MFTSLASSIPPVLAEVVRSGFVEGHHRGAVVMLAADGSVERAIGDVTSPVFSRSCAKPMQAAAVLRAGLPLSGERLALAAASHAGEDFHQELARTILAEHGLTEAALRCPADLPADQEALEAHLAAGRGRTRLAMNCSGKHAAKLAACVTRGWPTDTYLAPDHPLQLLVQETVEAVAEEPVAHVGVDGCGAPVFAFSLTGLARSFRAFVLAAEGTPERRVADAMRAHPQLVAGTRKLDSLLMRALPGTLSKEGAEGLQAVALPDGRAVALKVSDGAGRARGPVLGAALAALGVTDPGLGPVTRSVIEGGGAPVGEVRAVF